MRVAFVIIYCAISMFSNGVYGARILGLFPHTGRSHHMVFEPLLRTLAERGHHVTVASFFPLKSPPANYKDISFEGLADVGLDSFDLNWFESSLYKIPKVGNILHVLGDLNILAAMAVNTCGKVIDLPTLNEALKEEYDVVLMENFDSDCMFGLLHAYEIKAPVIGLSSCILMPWLAERIGASTNPAYVSLGTTAFTSSMTFLERMENTFSKIYFKLWYRYRIQNEEQALIEKRFGRKIPELETLARNISLLLVNTFHALNGATPLVPGLVEVGGMHLNQTKKDIPQQRRPLNMRVAFAIYCAIFAFSNDVYGARILGLFHHIGKSHYMVYEPLLRKLAERGHHVTVASFFPLKDPPANYKDISFEGIADVGLESLDLKWFESSVLYKIPTIGSILQVLGRLNVLGSMAVSICSKVIDLPSLNQALKKEYDLVLMENFNSDCMFGLLYAHNIKAPIIGLSSCVLFPWLDDRMGVTNNPSYVPGRTTAFTSSMTFLERVENSFWEMYFKLWYRYRIQGEEQALIEKRFGRKIPELETLARNISLLLVNTFHALNGATPLVPGLVQVGGMHLNQTKKDIPQYIERFLNESEHGVILLSFGSLIKTATMPKYKEDIIVNALSKFKQRIIWKYEDSAEEGNLTGNILRVRWLPQYELLQHKSIIAFIAHGGLLGMTEAVSAGKPMVVVPFFGDQPANGAAAAAAGFAKVLPYDDLTEEALTDAVRSVLSAEMRMNARRISKMWKDRESSPLDTAIFWTERVIRWGHAAPLHTAARELAFYELALLDVAAAYILALIVLVTIIWYFLSKISQIIFVRQPKLKMH